MQFTNTDCANGGLGLASPYWPTMKSITLLTKGMRRPFRRPGASLPGGGGGSESSFSGGGGGTFLPPFLRFFSEGGGGSRFVGISLGRDGSVGSRALAVCSVFRMYFRGEARRSDASTICVVVERRLRKSARTPIVCEKRYLPRKAS